MEKSNRIYFFIKIIFIALVLFFMFVLILTLTNGVYGNNDVSAKGIKLFGNFMKYENKVYVNTDKNEYVLIKEADLKTFDSVSEFYSPSVAKDKNHVYCGSEVVPFLNPNTTKSLGNHYYSDGKNTYYLSPISKRVEELNFFREVFNTVKKTVFNRRSNQTYKYSIRKLKNTKEEYKIILDGLVATDGVNAYVFGKHLSNANPKTLKRIPIVSEGDIGDSYNYFTDGKNVYFKNNLMDLEYNKNIYSLNAVSHSDKYYLYNGLDGSVYLGEKRIGARNEPYKIISTYDSHINQLLLLSKKGVYFYNMNTKKMERAGDNPFLNNDFEEISPFIFSNGEEIYYIDSYDEYYYARHGGGLGRLDYKATTINKVNNFKIKGNFSKVKDVFYGCSIWKNGDDFYYFDNIGETNLLEQRDYFNKKEHDSIASKISPIYKIKDANTLNIMMDKDDIEVGEFVRRLIDNGTIIPVKGSEVLIAKTKYSTEENFHRFIVLAVAVTVIIAMMIFAPIYFRFKRKKLLNQANSYINRIEKLKIYKLRRRGNFKTIIFLVIIMELFLFLIRIKTEFFADELIWNIFQIILALIIPLMLVAIKQINKNFDRSIGFFEQNYYLNMKPSDLLLSELLECVEHVIVNYDKGVVIDLEKHHDFNIQTFVGRYSNKTYILNCKDQNGKKKGFALDYIASFYKEDLVAYIDDVQNNHLQSKK